jgi:hypothetical protein
MAWETRSGSRYYYRSKKTADGRVIKQYCGRGRRAHQAARAAAEARRRAEEERQALTDEKARLAEIDGMTGEVLDAIQLLTEAIFLANNFHRKNYGPWRRRHGC